MTTPETSLQRHLQQLQEVPLPDALWQRVDDARSRRLRHRRIGLATMAMAAVAIVSMSLLIPPDIAPDVNPVAVDATTVDPATLDPAGLDPVGSAAGIDATPAPDNYSELRAIDRALQAGYARDASDAELAPLWAARARLAGDQDNPSSAPSGGAVRI